MSKGRRFVESRDGVHLLRGEFTLCGDAMDIDAVDSDHGGFTEVRSTALVTCPRCIDVIDACRGVDTFRSRSVAAPKRRKK